MSVSSFMGYLKGKSSLMIYEKYPELKYKYRNREFWCRGYYVDTVGKNAKVQTIVRRLTALSLKSASEILQLRWLMPMTNTKFMTKLNAGSARKRIRMQSYRISQS